MFILQTQFEIIIFYRILMLFLKCKLGTFLTDMQDKKKIFWNNCFDLVAT